MFIALGTCLLAGPSHAAEEGLAPRWRVGRIESLAYKGKKYAGDPRLDAALERLDADATLGLRRVVERLGAGRGLRWVPYVSVYDEAQGRSVKARLENGSAWIPLPEDGSPFGIFQSTSIWGESTASIIFLMLRAESMVTGELDQGLLEQGLVKSIFNAQYKPTRDEITAWIYEGMSLWGADALEEHYFRHFAARAVWSREAEAAGHGEPDEARLDFAFVVACVEESHGVEAVQGIFRGSVRRGTPRHYLSSELGLNELELLQQQLACVDRQWEEARASYPEAEDFERTLRAHEAGEGVLWAATDFLERWPHSRLRASVLALEGHALAADERHAEAEQRYLQSLEGTWHPYVGEATLGLARSVAAQGRHAQALERYLGLIHDHPEYAADGPVRAELSRLRTQAGG